MSTEDDPFADPAPADKTVIRPRPGGARRAAVVPPEAPAAPRPRPAAAAPAAIAAEPVTPAGAVEDEPAEAMDLGGPAPLPTTGLNPMARAAGPLLGLAVRLKGRASHRNIEALRDRVISEIKRFESRALQDGVAPEAIRAGRYFLAATIDDLILNTPWGSGSVWARQSMVVNFYNEAWGGERFFEILDHVAKDPERNLDVLELAYLCLTLGFEGMYRVEQRGKATLDQIRDSLYRTIRRRRGDIERSLSPHWRGAEAGHRPLTSLVPLWVVAAIAGLILTGLFIGFTYLLNRDSDVLFDRLASLPPNGPVVIARSGPVVEIYKPAPVVYVPVPMEPTAPPSTAANLSRFLEPEIEQGLVTVLEDAQTTTVRIRNSGPGGTGGGGLAAIGLFASGSATINDEYLELIDRIGKALDDEPGSVLVNGHTDNVPIRTTRFPSNWHLSIARAESVVALLTPNISDVTRLTADGKSDTEPVIDNATDEHRDQNRRIEIIVMKQ